MGSSVFARVFSLTPEAARLELSKKFGEQLERWVHQADARPTDVARELGFKRTHLYKLFRGTLPFHASWLYLLPPAVLRRVLDDLAASIGYELRPAAADELPADYDHARDGCDYLRELTDCLRRRVENEADGELHAPEIDAELRDIEEARVLLARRETLLRAAKARGGGSVASIVDRARARRIA